MNVMRVTQFHSADAAIDRRLFQLLEYFSSFCLIGPLSEEVMVPLSAFLSPSTAFGGSSC